MTDSSRSGFARIALPLGFIGLVAGFWGVIAAWSPKFMPMADFIGIRIEPSVFQLYLVWLGFVAALTFLFRHVNVDVLTDSVTRRWRAIALGCSGVAVVIAWFWAVVVMQQSWMADDTQSYLLQAEGIARGTVTLPAPAEWPSLTNNLVFAVGERDGVTHWSGPYMPGQPTLLALSNLFGFVYLVQVLLVGLMVFHTSALAHELAGERAATIAALLMTFSPMVGGIGGTLHTAVPAAAFSLFAARALVRWVRTRSTAAGLATGFLSACAVCCRPVEGAAIVLVCCAVFAVVSYRDKTFVRSIALLVVGAVLPTLYLGATNYVITGSPFELPYSVLEKWLGEYYGFSAKGVWTPDGSHSPSSALASVLVTAIHLSVWMFGAPTAIVAAIRRGVPSALEVTRKVIFAGIAFVVVAYALAPFISIADFGSYYHLGIVPPVAVLVAASLAMRADDESATSRGTNWATVVLVTLGFTWLTFVPLQMQKIGATAESIQQPIRAATEQAEPPALIFYQAPMQVDPYSSAVLFHPLPIKEDQPLIWARMFDEESNKKAKAAHSDRKPYQLMWEDGAWVLKPVSF